MARHVRVQCALIRPQGTKDSSTRDPDVNHSTFNTHTHTQHPSSVLALFGCRCSSGQHRRRGLPLTSTRSTSSPTVDSAVPLVSGLCASV